jgi:uncharacterized protein YjbI with pentapeptide repeats
MNWRETIVFLIVAIGTVSVLVSALWMMLARQLKPSSFQEKKDFIQLIAQILGGATIIITLFSTWYSVRENERKTEESAAAARDNLRIAVETLKETRNRQIAERYARGAEQLGSVDHKFRVGAIYGLQQVANDSDEFYPSVVELLTSYVVENASWQNANRRADQLPADIQAAFNVLGWRKCTWGKGEDRRLELHGTDLRGLILKNKEGVADGGAHLEGAQLWNSHFEGPPGTTNLRYIHLEKAGLKNANLEGAYLFGAFLQDADLTGARINEADLSFAKITPEQVAVAVDYECAKYDPNFEKALEEFKRNGGPDVLNDYLSRKRACKKTKQD